jgi:UDP-N-acetylglucosamine 2-epimerase (non-hydrolysing)/GDP/UDP-N,N'-diacetylbacillosamine 2-epimerase (hydrolysing)
MKEIRDDPDLELQVIVTGAHLSPEFGLTWKEIEEDGFPIHKRVEMLLSGDSTVSVTKSLGLGIIGFADALEEMKPDILVILGDRYEMLGAAAAGVLAGVPVAHLSGGEVTLGAYDDAFRHAISKMSSLHFVAHEEYRRRVIQMGEVPDSVFVVGPACLDGIRETELPTRKELEQYLGIPLSAPLFVVTYHPETRSSLPVEEQINRLLSALDRFPSATMVFTGANADTNGRIINERMIEFCRLAPEKRVFVQSLGRKRYWGMLSISDAVIGNSSSGILEAPLFGVPVVNIGARQQGRIRGDLVIDCPCEAEEQELAIQKVLTCGRRSFKRILASDRPAKSICAHLKNASFEKVKRFYDIQWTE